MLPGEFYHVYNHANGNEKLFLEERNYYFFLDKISKYILPVIKIHAYCLMSNHFHLLIEVRREEELITHFSKIRSQEYDTKLLEEKVSNCFSNMFNSYTQAFNRMYERMGSLFMPSCKQKPLLNMDDYCHIVKYIHTNPVHHGFVKRITDWKFSSYNAFLSDKKTLLERAYVLNTFGGLEAFINFHNTPFDLKFDITF